MSTVRKYRGYECRRLHGLQRGSWGSWEVYRNGKFIDNRSTFDSCVYLIDLQPDAEPVVVKPRKRRNVQRIKTPRVISDAGRRAHGFTHETNDCTVRAISHARCISYAQAHALCRELFDRKDGKGTYYTGIVLARQPWARIAWERKWDREAQRFTTVTLDRFVADHPTGHYVVLVRGHSVAVCDGVVYDGFGVSGLVRVESAYEVIA